MAFELNSVVPWGRTFGEYEKMFMLSSEDIDKRIISFGDGPASFNAEMAEMGKKVTSIDPIYQFTAAQIAKRIEETRAQVINQTRENERNFVWDAIKSVDDLEEIRMKAMGSFLLDFKKGYAEKRYISHSLPDKANFADNEFELGLSSHFLLLYPKLGFDFHLSAIREMMRICTEVRIFPILTLDVKLPDFFNELLDVLNQDYFTEIRKVPYEFQKGGNEMLVIKKRVD
ncbi:MAG TPA: hypothetical protein VNX40_13310 [Mucilaginibacter sp.]|jgi:hypothetical protein|nr:hypothetical protein [Mucilaginibacter sp.]